MLLGRNELALRFPEIFGVILFSWCMYFFVGKRLGRAFGLTAMILPLITDLELYAGEARPYGMMLGVCGLALLAWRNAVENPRRRLALALFAMSLALIAGTHAFGIVPVSVFAVGELARYLKTRRPDTRLWLCFLAVIPPMALYWFPLQAIQEVVVGPEKWAHWSDFPFFYQRFFINRVGLLVLTRPADGGPRLAPQRPQSATGRSPVPRGRIRRHPGNFPDLQCGSGRVCGQVLLALAIPSLPLRGS